MSLRHGRILRVVVLTGIGILVLLMLGLGMVFSRMAGERTAAERFMRRDARIVYEAAKAGDYAIIEKAHIGQTEYLIKNLRQLDKDRGRVLSYEIMSVSFPAHAATKCLVSLRAKREKGVYVEQLFGLVPGFDAAW